MVYRGWRFVHPDFDDGGEFVGLPLSAQGGIGMVEGDNAVRQAILLLNLAISRQSDGSPK